MSRTDALPSTRRSIRLTRVWETPADLATPAGLRPQFSLAACSSSPMAARIVDARLAPTSAGRSLVGMARGWHAPLHWRFGGACRAVQRGGARSRRREASAGRSEEHTSEPQSRPYL